MVICSVPSYVAGGGQRILTERERELKRERGYRVDTARRYIVILPVLQGEAAGAGVSHY
jgi:hypothetical protein